MGPTGVWLPSGPDIVDRRVSEFESVVFIGVLPEAGCAVVRDGQWSG